MAVTYLKSLSRHFLPLAVAITLMFGVVYIIVQQQYRVSANDPQIQLAEDAAAVLEKGQAVQTIIPSTQVDIASSLAPYVVVYDDTGTAVASSGLLHGRMPVLPAGVFNFTRRVGEDRLTWQPESGVRSATVIVHYQGTHPGFVMAGRSLREVEKRIDMLTLQAGAGWVGTLFLTFIVTVFVELLLRRA